MKKTIFVESSLREVRLNLCKVRLNEASKRLFTHFCSFVLVFTQILPSVNSRWFQLSGYDPSARSSFVLLHLPSTETRRMHSSRMRTVRCSDRLEGDGVCLPRGVYVLEACLPESVCLARVYTPSPADRFLDRSLWNIAVVADGNNSIVFMSPSVGQKLLFTSLQESYIRLLLITDLKVSVCPQSAL